jgi:diketogulonate reductase-like aldo/keto reductase
MVLLPTGHRVPALGMGTWKMGESAQLRTAEIAALRLGIELGMTIIDTAEMYGEGESERLVGQAIAPDRDKVFVVSKVYPHNASRNGVVEACERSLRRLRTDRIDLYLLHWRGSYPLTETVQGFEYLRASGKIRSWGVSNFDVDDMQEVMALAQGEACATNQILYNLCRRGPEFDLLPWLSQRNVPAMAYSPIEQGRIGRSSELSAVARQHNASEYQVALAWLLRRRDVIAIPKSGNIDHIRENHAAITLSLTAEDFAKPSRKEPLAML